MSKNFLTPHPGEMSYDEYYEHSGPKIGKTGREIYQALVAHCSTDWPGAYPVVQVPRVEGYLQWSPLSHQWEVNDWHAPTVRPAEDMEIAWLHAAIDKGNLSFYIKPRRHSGWVVPPYACPSHVADGMRLHELEVSEAVVKGLGVHPDSIALYDLPADTPLSRWAKPMYRRARSASEISRLTRQQLLELADAPAEDSDCYDVLFEKAGDLVCDVALLACALTEDPRAGFRVLCSALYHYTAECHGLDHDEIGEPVTTHVASYYGDKLVYQSEH